MTHVNHVLTLNLLSRGGHPRWDMMTYFDVRGSMDSLASCYGTKCSGTFLNGLLNVNDSWLVQLKHAWQQSLLT